jgi:hypothetical protein
MIRGAARRGGCENYVGFAAQYLWLVNHEKAIVGLLRRASRRVFEMSDNEWILNCKFNGVQSGNAISAQRGVLVRAGTVVLPGRVAE